MTSFRHGIETYKTSGKGYTMGARTGPRFLKEFKVRNLHSYYTRVRRIDLCPSKNTPNIPFVYWTKLSLTAMSTSSVTTNTRLQRAINNFPLVILLIVSETQCIWLETGPKTHHEILLLFVVKEHDSGILFENSRGQIWRDVVFDYCRT